MPNDPEDDDVGKKMVQATEPTRAPNFPFVPALSRLFSRTVMGNSTPPPSDDPWLADRAKAATQSIAAQQAKDKQQAARAARPGARIARKPKQQ